MVRIRMRRMGARNQPFYRIVVMDSRKPRDGAYIEKLGHYDPLKQPHEIIINGERAISWLKNGAQPSKKVLSLLKKVGVWKEFCNEKKGLKVEKVKETEQIEEVKEEIQDDEIVEEKVVEIEENDELSENNSEVEDNNLETEDNTSVSENEEQTD